MKVLRTQVNAIAHAVADHAVMLDRYHRGEVTRDAVVTKQQVLDKARADLLATINTIEDQQRCEPWATPLPGESKVVGHPSNVRFANA